MNRLSRAIDAFTYAALIATGLCAGWNIALWLSR